MHVSISAIAVAATRILKIADHGDRHTSVARQLLSQTESCRGYALVSFLDTLQLCVLRPVALHSPRQAVDTVDVKIQFAHISGSAIGAATSLSAGAIGS